MKWQPWSRRNEKDLPRYVTREAGRSVPLDSSSFDQEPTLKGRRRIVEAIYGALLQKGIWYALEEYHPSVNLQAIRSPDEVLAERKGTCLDLAALFCGLCLANELLPMLIVTEGHAFAAVSLSHGLREWNSYRPERPKFENDVLRDPDLLREWIEEGSWLAVECTGFARSEKLGQIKEDPPPESRGREDDVLSFDRAIAAGREQLEYGSRRFQFALDIAVAHYWWRIEPYSIHGPISSISIGLTPEQIKELASAITQQGALAGGEVERLSRQLNLTQEAVAGFFRTLNERDVPIERLPEKLAEIAQRHCGLLERLSALDAENIEGRELIGAARAAIEASDHDRADELLGKAEAEELGAVLKAEEIQRQAQAAMERRRLAAAALRAQRGELSLIRLDYVQAGDHFKAAGDLLQQVDQLATEADYLNRAAVAYRRYGDEKGDNEYLLRAIDLCRCALENLSRERMPLPWARTQDNLGTALQVLGGRESGDEQRLGRNGSGDAYLLHLPCRATAREGHLFQSPAANAPKGS